MATRRFQQKLDPTYRVDAERFDGTRDHAARLHLSWIPGRGGYCLRDYHRPVPVHEGDIIVTTWQNLRHVRSPEAFFAYYEPVPEEEDTHGR